MLGQRIAAYRKRAGWSQAELARRINVSHSAISMYEQGRREPSVDVLVALAEEFQITADALICPSRQMLQDIQGLGEMPDGVRQLLGSWLQGRLLNTVSRDELAVLCFALLLGEEQK